MTFRRWQMASGSWPLRLLLVALVLGACSNGVLAQATPAQPGARPSFCPLFNDVSTAAGFPVTLKVEGGSADSFDCVYELTGRYHGTTLELTGEPASLAGDVFSKV